jgi:hypothetical protein
MAAYNEFQPWVEYLTEGVNCGSDQFVVALTNTLPVNTYATLSQISEISYTNLSSRNLTTTSSSQSGGTFKLDFNDLTMTASGAVGPFRYVVIYDDTVAGDPLVAWFDYGSAITMANGDTFTLTFDPTNGLFTVA